MGKSKGKLKIGNPIEQLDKIASLKDKYKVGSTGLSFYDIREIKPVFAFDYLSLGSTELCFDCPKLSTIDYVGLLAGLKTNSQFTYNELKNNPYYRFHKINFDTDNVSIKKKDFKQILSFKPEEISDDELPTLYQFDLHYKQKARACGFLYKGIFYLVWFDKDHIIYPGN